MSAAQTAQMKAALTDSLIQETSPRHFGGKASVLFAFLAGAGLTMLLNKVTNSDSLTAQESAIDMPALSKSVMQPAKAAMFTQPHMGAMPLVTRGAQSSIAHRNEEALRTNAFPKSALAGFSDLPTSSGLIDVRNALSLPGQMHKCVNAGPHASVCGNLVVLRPMTSLRAENKADDVIKDISSKLDAVEDKGQVALYAGGAVVALVVLNGIVTSLESIPLLPKLFEIVGAGYSAYFTYRYLLNKANRAELVADIERVKDDIFR